MKKSGACVNVFTGLVVAFCCLMPPNGAAERISTETVTHTVRFSEADFLFGHLGEYDYIRSPEGDYLNQPGRPMLPSRIIRIALPDGMAVTGVRLDDIGTRDLEGRFDIFPAQYPVAGNDAEKNRPFIAPDPAVYQSDAVYPSEPLELLGQADLAGQSFARVAVYPLHYAPNRKTLTLVTSLTFTVEGRTGYICGDYLPERSDTRTAATYRKRLRTMVANPGDVVLATAPAGLKNRHNLPPGDPFDHVIITSGFNAAWYQPLVDWHMRSGMRDTVITVDYIYDNYGGPDGPDKIRSFITEAHQNWGTMYFLIGGEHGTVPFEYRTYDNTSIPADAGYADYDDDWEYEVLVGRVTAEGQQQIGTFVDKVITYETDPPLLNYPLNVTLLGMDLTARWEPPYYTLTAGEILKDSIDAWYISSAFNVTTIYDSDGGNHRDAFLAALNAGQNLVNHNDHSNSYVMGTGDRNHGWYISSYDIPSLTNTRKFSNIYSIGCHANKMDVEDAVSEHFIFDVDSTGAVSFTGNTRSGWFYVGDPFSLSSELDIYWWEALTEAGQTRLGEALAYAKSLTEIEYTWPYSEWTLNLLGEPAMPVWTGLPKTALVSHETEIEALPETFQVNVEMFGGSGVEQAYVCLWKGDEIYSRGYTDTEGGIDFEIYPTTNGVMYVTVTAPGYLPYMGEAVVVGNVPPACQIPGDTTVFQCTAETISLPVGCFDPDDNLASGPELIAGPGEIIDGYWVYTPGGEDSVTVTVGCTDSLEFSCEKTFIVRVDINDPPSCSLPADTQIVQLSPPDEIALPAEAFDDDDNVVAREVISGPGVVDPDGFWRYTPADDEVIDVTIRFTDGCQSYAEDSFQLIYEVFVCGDADDNGELNILDVTFLINYLYRSGAAPKPDMAGDEDGNGILNILDVTYLINYLYRQGPAPVCG